MKFFKLISLFTILLLVSCNQKPAEPQVVVKSKEDMRAKNGETVWIITNHVKDESKIAYESFMKDVFINSLATTTVEATKTIYQQTRYLTPKKQNRDSSWTYVFIMDPIVAGASYSTLDLFKEKYPPAKAMELDSLYETFMMTPPSLDQLVQSKD